MEGSGDMINKKALIVRGGWDGHQPVEVSQVFESILKTEGFEVDIFEDLNVFENLDNIMKYSLIVPVYTMSEIKEEYVQNICAAVESGVGLAGCHGGMCDSFRNSTKWQFLTGSQWVEHPGNDGIEYEVNIIKSSSSPIIEGINDFKVTTEHYYLHIDPVVNVLATTSFPLVPGPHSANGPVLMPIAYTKKWGKGRVFYTSLGHHADIFDVPEAKELMRRGFLWANNLL
jgi:type 1 glutamine amidotransferase